MHCLPRSRTLLCLLAALAVLAVGCGADATISVEPPPPAEPSEGNGDDPINGDDQSTTSNAAGDSGTVKIDADTKVKAAYLARVFEISAGLVEASTSIGPNDGVRPLAEAWLGAQAEFDTLSAPPQAQELHDGWLVLAEGMAEATLAFADVSEAGTQPEIGLAAQTFVEQTAALGADSLKLDALLSDLAIEVYEASDTSTDRYLAEVSRQNKSAASTVTDIFALLGEQATSPDALSELLETFAALASLRDTLAQLDPPTDFAELHNERLRLLDELRATGEELQEALSQNVAPSPQLTVRLQQFNADSQAWNMAFSRASAAAMRSIAEG